MFTVQKGQQLAPAFPVREGSARVFHSQKRDRYTKKAANVAFLMGCKEQKRTCLHEEGSKLQRPFLFEGDVGMNSARESPSFQPEIQTPDSLWPSQLHQHKPPERPINLLEEAITTRLEAIAIRFFLPLGSFLLSGSRFLLENAANIGTLLLRRFYSSKSAIVHFPTELPVKTGRRIPFTRRYLQKGSICCAC